MAVVFRTLGPLELDVDGASVHLGGPKLRGVLALLLLEPGRLVPADAILDAVWPGRASIRSLQVHVSELRARLGGAARIVGEAGGYRLQPGDADVDHIRFERLIGEGRSMLAQDDPASGAERLREALGLWRGPPFADAAAVPPIEAEANRLTVLRMAALEAAIDAELGLGRHTELVAELEALVHAEPLREPLRRQLMLALYRSGRQADALAVYHDTRRQLVRELGLEPGPELQAIEAAILRQDPTLTVESPDVARRRRLPASPTALVGREREVGEVVDLLAGTTRLVTLTGPGGTGKTRIALQAAHVLGARLAGGSTFVGLAALRDPALVPTEIAAALGIVVAGDPVAEVAARLGAQPTLLLLDNFEQVDEAAPDVSRLLAAAPGLRILVTSRHRLRLYGEHEYAIAPLDIDAEAVPLFVARAEAAGRRLAAGDPGVRAVCVRLEGLPLAIELAAARAREVPLAEMVSSLPRLDLARDGPRDVPARQQTMEAAIAWSHQLLAPYLRNRLAALSVFAGGFAADAALTVTGATTGDLAELASRSLLRERSGRWEMLEVVREFEGARLAESGEAERIRRAHATWYLDLAEGFDATLRSGGDSPAALAGMALEHDNLRAASAWALVADPGLALRLAVAMGYFGEWRGHSGELRAVLERTLEVSHGAPEALRVKALLRLGIFAQMQGDNAAAVRAHEDALAAARRTGDEALAGKALRNLATIARDEQDFARADRLLEEAHAMSEAIGDRMGVLVSLINRSDVALTAGDPARARKHARSAVRLGRALEHELDVALALLNLALAELRLGRASASAAAYDEALELCMRNGYIEGAAYALLGMAVLLEEPAPAEAARLIGSADATLARVGAVLESTERPLRNDLVARLKAALGPEEADALIAIGERRELDAAVAAARRSLAG